MKLCIWTILGALVLGTLSFALWLGALRQVEVQRGPQGPLHLAYLAGRGPYRQAPKLIAEVEAKLLAAGIKGREGFGVYFDDPAKVASADLRWEAGLLLDEAGMQAAKKAQAKSGLQLKELPRSEGLRGSFPRKHVVSILLGIYKVYPALERARVAAGWAQGPVMEVYGEQEIEYLLLKP